MCGIAGFYSNERNYIDSRAKWEKVINKMNRIQKHRGPDDEGTYLSEKCVLGHVRLSIIDIAKGHQPMMKKYNEHECVVVYNGEIYNMKELKEQLEYIGITFETDSDTEVLVSGYLKYGESFIKRLNGIFSIALFDITLNKLLLIRDRLGVKPLFYSIKNNEIAFSSEIKGIFEHPGFLPEIDKETLQIIMGLGPAKPEGSGVFKDIQEVKPGHYLRISQGEIKDIVYWKLISQPHEDSEEMTIQKTKWLVEDSIKKQMLSDIPISTFLSGGIDSSIVTAICSNELKKENKVLNTFSFDFEDNDKHFKANSFQPSRDYEWVNIMKEYSKTNHRYLICDNDNLESYLYKAVDGRDLPCMADVESSMLYFCEKVAKYNKVTLTGECADEIFGGYPWFYRKELYEANTFPWSIDMEMRNKVMKKEMRNELNVNEYVKKTYDEFLLTTPYLRGENSKEKRRREISYMNIKWFMTNLLERMDRTSMQCGLEARVPFADHRIVEYLWNVPWEMKYKNQTEKSLLRSAMKGKLPESVLYRKKSPYPKTYNPEYEIKLLDKAIEVVSDSSSSISNIIEINEMFRWKKEIQDYGRPWYGQLMAGPQMLAYILQIDYWLKKYKLSV